MKVKKRLEIISMSLTVVFLFAGIALAQGEWTTNSGGDIYNTHSDGKVGIGTASPRSPLEVYNKGNAVITARIAGEYPAVSASGTRYYKQLQINEPRYKIPSGITDRGYRIGLAVQGYVHTEDFAGILASQFGAWIRTGSNSSAPSGHINNSYAVYVENLSSPNVSIDNSYGIFQSSSYAKNYFAGNVGIGTKSPGAVLEIESAGAPDFLRVDMAGAGRGIAFERVAETPSIQSYSNIDWSKPAPLALQGAGGNVGIGTANPRSPLEVYNRGNAVITARIAGEYPAVSASGTRYYKQLQINEPRYKIPSGITDRGYRIGLAVQGYVHTEDFAGILASQFGAWIRTGSNSSAPSGHINNSYAVYVENLSSPNVSIDNSYGIFQSSSYAKNYFAGNVGIGTKSPQAKLAVNGTIAAKEIKVESGWSDFVFDEDYDLAPLDKVESYIYKNKHLPDIPSAKEVTEQGLAVSEILAKQMQKIEELTLYLINMKKENDQLKERVAALEGSIEVTVK